MYNNAASYIQTPAAVLSQKRRPLAYALVFFVAMFALSSVKSQLLPVVVAAALVPPLRFLLYHGAKFEQEAYVERFPVVANLTNQRFGTLVGILTVIPVAHTIQGDVLLWSEFGTLSFVIGVAAIGVMTWSKSLYARNFYYDQWHLDLRLLVILSGILSIVTPVFIPIFLTMHHLSSQQFDRLPVGKSNSRLGHTHSALPLTMLLVITVFTITTLAFDVQPYMVVFLLFCGYAAHYFHSGIAKLRFGVRYYILQNNPFFLSMNAYQSGWLRGISEETVARLGVLTNRIKPVLNSAILLTEVGAIAILFSYHVALAVACLTLLLHLSIFSTSGDNFWQWMSINAATIGGLLTAPASATVLFANTSWFLVSLLFIGFANKWMKPKQLGWLDSPYYESYRIEAEFDDRPAEHLNTRVFRPLEETIRQGFSGSFRFLGTNPRTSHNWGDVSDIEAHEYLTDLYPEQPDAEQEKYLVEELGEDLHDQRRTEKLEKLVEQFVAEQEFSGSNSVLRHLTPPQEQYHRGFPDTASDGIPETEPDRLRMYRIDGIWTRDGFHEISREELFSVAVNESSGRND